MSERQKIRIIKYGIVLRELEHKDIEMVRNWRNDPDVARYAINKDYITPEMQDRWFQGIRERNEWHLVINYEGRDIGLWTIKDIDEKNRTAECGVYLATESDRNSFVPYLVSLGVEDFIRSIGVRKVKVYILDENKRAIRYNKSLGFVATDTLKNGNARLYWLDLENNECSSRLKKVLGLEE